MNENSQKTMKQKSPSTVAKLLSAEVAKIADEIEFLGEVQTSEITNETMIRLQQVDFL